MHLQEVQSSFQVHWEKLENWLKGSAMDYPLLLRTEYFNQVVIFG